jgi:hypothetical protein
VGREIISRPQGANLFRYGSGDELVQARAVLGGQSFGFGFDGGR